jgi:hypothetical protein
MPQTAPKFSCNGCQRNYTWKPEIAGKRVKCKCGNVITVPQNIDPPATEEDDLYALAEDAEKAAAQPSRLVAAAPPPPKATASAAPTHSRSGIPLAYKSGPSPREIERAAAAGLDMQRDVYAPLIFLSVGFLLCISYYVIHYNLGANGIIFISVGLTVMTVVEAAFLVGFALVIATPLGVGFGDFRSAILKLAAITVFNDGVITWIDAAVTKFAGFSAGGLFGFGIVGLPVAVGVYWSLLIYLFSMDPGDSWLVVIILAVIYRIFRFALTLLLLGLVLSWGGVRSSAMPSFGGSRHNAVVNPMVNEVEEAKGRGLLSEGRQYIADGHQGVLKDVVDEWYADGSPNVWFERGRDINGRGRAFQLIVELPEDPAKRAKCYQTLKSFYTADGLTPDPSDLVDTGEPYLMLELR